MEGRVVLTALQTFIPGNCALYDSAYGKGQVSRKLTFNVWFFDDHIPLLRGQLRVSIALDTSVVARFLLPLPRSLDNPDIPIQRKLGETLDLPARLRPLYLQPIDARPLADAEHNPRVVRRKKTASAHLHPLPFQFAGLVGDAGSDRVRIRLAPDQMHPQPMILATDFVLQQDRRAVIR